MKTIKLPCYGIVVELTEDGGGSISSNLHEELFQEELDSLTVEDINEKNESLSYYNSAIDGIEALILGAACAGVDIESPAFLESIESAVDGCANNIY